MQTIQSVQKPDTIDLIIPALNEQENIPALCAALQSLRERLRHVVLVDNGSTDATASLARENGLHVVHEPSRGYGAACLAGLAWIQEQEIPDAVAFLDADLSDDPQALLLLCDCLFEKQADLVIGSRAANAERGALEPHQRFGNTLACLLMRLGTGYAYRDLGPMRVIRWQALEALQMADRTWGWTVEMQYKAARLGMKIEQVDVPYRCRHAGVSKISGSIRGSVRAGTKILTTVARLWWSGIKHRS